jgi:hypothetical protein
VRPSRVPEVLLYKVRRARRGWTHGDADEALRRRMARGVRKHEVEVLDPITQEVMRERAAARKRRGFQ